MEYVITLFIGAVVAASIVWAIMRGWRQRGFEQGKAEEQARIGGLEERLARVSEDLARERSQLEHLNGEFESIQLDMKTISEDRARLQERAGRLPELERRNEELQLENRKQATRVQELETLLDQERVQSQEKLELLHKAEQALSERFRNLANEILDEKSKKFTEQNQSNLGALLTPLREQIEGFKTKVEETYQQEARERHTLKNEIEKLAKSNVRISDEADNLVRALKGNAKTQGNWGEMMLEQVLDSSGLRKKLEYDVQVSVRDEEGGRSQPDVVVHLPEDKHIIIDSKVSLVAYERFANAETDAERENALKAHTASIRAHIKGLSAKEYQNRYGLKSLDFVLMFIPIEPAFMSATTADRQLFQDAWAQNIVLVSPSTLLAMLRTIASVWRQEYQNVNARKIAERGAELYNKLAGFVDDLERIGKRIDDAQKTYVEAHKKLTTGRGNVIRQAEMLRELGVKPSKELPAELIEQADASEERAKLA